MCFVNFIGNSLRERSRYVTMVILFVQYLGEYNEQLKQLIKCLYNNAILNDSQVNTLFQRQCLQVFRLCSHEDGPLSLS